MYQIRTRLRYNSKHYKKIVAEFETEQEVLDYLKANNLRYEGTPYVFTHINLSNNHIITQSVIAGSDKVELICSPVKLDNLLKQ